MSLVHAQTMHENIPIDQTSGLGPQYASPSPKGSPVWSKHLGIRSLVHAQTMHEYTPLGLHCKKILDTSRFDIWKKKKSFTHSHFKYNPITLPQRLVLYTCLQSLWRRDNRKCLNTPATKSSWFTANFMTDNFQNSPTHKHGFIKLSF